MGPLRRTSRPSDEDQGLLVAARRSPSLSFTDGQEHGREARALPTLPLTCNRESCPQSAPHHAGASLIFLRWAVILPWPSGTQAVPTTEEPHLLSNATSAQIVAAGLGNLPVKSFFTSSGVSQSESAGSSPLRSLKISKQRIRIQESSGLVN